MIFRRFLKGNKAPEQKVSHEWKINEFIIQIQNGDQNLRNQLIKEYQPFIIKVSSKVCKRYIDPKLDDEFSIALAAFNEAIDSFHPDQNTSFFTFADTVIRNRLIDYIRKESKYLKQIPMTTFDLPDEEDHVVNVVELKQSVSEYQQQQQAEHRREEILRFTQKMAEYGITLADLVQSSPKHQDARENLFAIADILVRDQNMVQYLMETKTLPIKELLTKVKVSRKTIERNRKYIIAIAMIQIYDFHHLREYIQVGREKRVGR